MNNKIEELREIMYKKIEQYGCSSKEALIASQNLDKCINERSTYGKQI
ncbi:aspartyl-phosphate phosphatase Spo0E family protein [Clostridium botulinum]|nr:aspartyl-phosphate phosphatase Spo0E family protein [Clostridium botulinum]MBN1035797.1 aspartyl-phosphate phosphatase Spo0E family protein [Clostridium botulinum]